MPVAYQTIWTTASHLAWPDLNFLLLNLSWRAIIFRFAKETFHINSPVKYILTVHVENCHLKMQMSNFNLF